jgi:hypothetical protein
MSALWRVSLILSLKRSILDRKYTFINVLKALASTTNQSQSHIATDGQSVSLGVEPLLRMMTRYLLLFDSYGLALCRVTSLTRERVCLLYMLLALASAVFLGSESRGTRYHILLSQI